MSRKPNQRDLERMSECLALVTAYEIGTEEADYQMFGRLTREMGYRDDSVETIRTLAQMCWLLTKSIQNSTDMDSQEVLQWYGQRFAQRSSG